MEYKKSSLTVDKSPHIAYLLIERSLKLITGRRIRVKISHIPYDVARHATPMETQERNVITDVFLCAKKR